MSIRIRYLFVALLFSLLFTAVAHAGTKEEARRYFQKGMAFIESGEPEKGVELLKKAYEIRPHRNVLFNIARAYASMGRVNRAIEYFERYLKTNPRDTKRVKSTLEELRLRSQLRSLVNEGMKAIKAGRYLEGVVLLERAYARRPHKNILFNIARAYESAGNERRAIENYQRYLERSPRDAKRVRKRIARLRKKTRRARVAVADRRPERKRKPDRRKRGRRPVEEEVPAKPAPATLDADQLDRIAAVLIDKMKSAGAFERPPPVVIEKPVEPEPPKPEEPSVEVAMTDTATAIAAATVELEAKSGEAYEDVVVTASRRAQSPLDAPNAVTIITDEEIRLSGARTIPDLLRRVPGMEVMAMSYSDFNVAMRGFNRRLANKILVLIDGRTAYQDFLGGMLWRGLTIDLMDIDRIEVVRGPGSAIYGAYAYTGIINIIMKRPERLDGSVVTASAGNGNRIETSFQFGERRGPVGIRVSVGYDRGDKYELEFDPNRVDYTTNVETVKESLDQARFDVSTEYNLSDGRIFLGGGARSGTQELYSVSAMRNQFVDGREYNLRGGYQSELLSVRAFWNGTRATSTPQFYRTGLHDLGSHVVGDLVSVEPVFTPTLTLLGEHALVIGGEFRHKYIDWDYLDEPHTEDHFALFFQDSWSIASIFSMIASARLDLHPVIGTMFSPRVAAILKLSEGQALRISVGTAFRQPTQAETYLDLSVSSPVAGVAITLVGGRDALEPENIATIDVGYKLQTDFGEFEAVTYFNRVSNLIGQTPLQPTGVTETFRDDLGSYVGAQSLYINNPAKFLAFGTELSTHLYPIDGVDIGASYAFQYIFEEESGDRYTDAPMHKATVWALLRTQFGLDAGISAHLVSAQEWIEPSFDPDDPTGFNLDPLPVDASIVVIGRVGYRLLDDQLEIAVSGTNLADFGDSRHREHPFANRVEARLVGTVTARF